MFEIFFSNKRKLFKIDNFKLNEPINITNIDNNYLSCAEINNIVDFFFEDDNSNRQKWIIEKDENEENTYYIKSAFHRYNNTQYLGCPNLNNQVFLYTSKNMFTKWKIQNIENNYYIITYSGVKFNPREISLVVSRYNENIEWVLPYNDISIIYNKGHELNIHFNNIINLSNIGREGHTYLYHIIQNYNSLPNRVIFTQGSPFEHNHTFLYGIDNYNETMDVQPLGLKYLQELNIPPIDILEKYKTTTYYGLEYLVVNINKNTDNLPPYNFIDDGINRLIQTYNNRFPHCKSLIENLLERSNFPIVKQLNEIRFCYSALFSVIKKQIHKYDISVYQNLLNELISFNDQSGENGYILERLWLYIFED
uniref:Uncharacterized protein n=1 Tax=viral metagenome TaxID=1070528 RepID=A0A6C0EFJ1_9ZZZZ